LAKALIKTIKRAKENQRIQKEEAVLNQGKKKRPVRDVGIGALAFYNFKVPGHWVNMVGISLGGAVIAYTFSGFGINASDTERGTVRYAC
jgi:hypothetical protein